MNSFSQSSSQIATSNQTDSTNSYGIVLSNRLTTDMASKPSMNSSKTSSQDVIQEIPWDLQAMLTRFSYTKTVFWKASDISGSILLDISIPNDLLVSSITTAPFLNFNFWRGDVELQLQVTGTPFHQGKLLGVFLPLVSTTEAIALASNFSTLTINPCVHLFPNANTNAIIKIPFNNMQQYLDLTNVSGREFNLLGRFLIVVMNPLEFSTGATDTVSVSLFSRFINSEFKVPRISTQAQNFDITNSSSFNLQNLNINSSFSNSFPLTKSSLSSSYELLAPVQSVSKSKVPLSHVLASTIDKMADEILPSSVSGDVLSLIGNLLDKPTNPKTDRVVLSVANRMNFSTGEDQIDKLVVDPSQIFLCDNLTFGMDVDEMDYNYLKRKLSYLGTFQIKTADPIGTVVGSFPINPIPVDIILGRLVATPLISYLSFPFLLWRGALTYKFEVIATSLQTCKMFIGFNFGIFTPPVTLDVNAATSQYGQAFEINQGTNHVEVTVPFVSTTPYKFVPNGDVYTADNSTGYINVVILNPLVANPAVPSTINVNVYICGADDFELNTLTASNNVVSASIQSSTHLDAPLNITEVSIDQGTDALVAPSSKTVPRTHFSPQPIVNIQSYLKKYQSAQRMPSMFQNINGYDGYYISISDLFKSGLTYTVGAGTTLTQQRGLLTHYASMYRQFRGPLRFKIYDSLPTTTAAQGETAFVFYFPPTPPQYTASPLDFLAGYAPSIPYSLPSLIGSAYVPPVFAPFNNNAIRLPASVCGGSAARFLEFETPFVSRFMSVLLSNDSAFDGPGSLGNYFQQGYLLYVRPAVATSTPAFNVSFGDETRLGTLYNIPKVIVSTAKDNSGNLISAYPDDYPIVSPGNNTLFRLP